MTEHYACKGECGGSAEAAKACDMESCSHYGQMMADCDCTDGKHGKMEEPAEVAA